ncbi:Ig-like domain-containing protein, partial [Chryseobacterium populi]
MNIFRLTFVLMLMIINTLSAQRDTEHWIAPYYNSSAIDYTNTIFLSTDSTTPFGVEIYSNNTLLTTVTISKGNPQQYTLATNRIYTEDESDAFTVINKGVYLKATQPFFCNLRLANDVHAEIITCKGKAGIGKEFYIASSPNTNVAGNRPVYNFTAGILATEDNTSVTVSWNTAGLIFFGGTPTGNSHTFTLNKGQSFIFAGGGGNAFSGNIPNLTGFIGAKVTANKPVSLTNGSVSGNFGAGGSGLLGSSSDAILDQSVPLERLGNSFAMVKTRSTDPSLNMEGGLIVATENNTQIFLNGSATPVQTLNAGQWYRINESSYIAQPGAAGHSNMYISTSKNVYLYQFVGVGDSNATCGFNYIPPLNCFLPKKIDEIGNVDVMPGSGTTPNLKLNILTEAGATVTVNGTAPTPAQGPYPLAGSTQWVTYSLNNVTGNLTINSSRALTSGINGGYSSAGYGGYFAGFSSIPIIEKSGDCVPGAVLEVEAGFDSYQWMLNGVDIPGAISHTYTPTQAGNYTVRIQNGSCAAVVTPIFKVFSCLKLTTQNINVCSSQVITPTFTSSTQTPVPGTVTIVTPPTNGTAVVNPNGTITYTPTTGNGTDQIVYRFCGNAPEFIDCEQVTLNITIAPLTVNNTTLSTCPTSTSPPSATFNLTLAQPNISNAAGATFTYYVNQADATAGNASTIATPTAYTSGNATIYVRVKVGSCFKVAELQLNLTQSVVSTITASSTTICYGGNVTLTSGQATGNTWSTGATTPSITVTTPGTYTLTNSSGNCPSSPASITITAESDPNIQITGNLVFCQGSSTTLTATSAGTGNTYSWSNGTTGSTISVSAPGTYTVTVETPAGCQYQESVTVTQGAVPTVQNASLSECTNSTTATFDLTSAQPAISTTAGATFAYYVNQADAIAGNASTIATPTAYTSGNATIYVRVKVGTCFKVAELQLNVTQSAVSTITASSTTICYGGNVTLTSGQATGNTWSTGATTPSITVTTPGTYTLTNSTGNCTSSPASITITAESDPDVQI